MTSTLAPLLLVVLVVVSDVWVYADSSRAVGAGTPVRWRIGNDVIESPTTWLLGCVVLWLVCFPAYLVIRKS